MPHQCVRCGKLLDDGAKEILTGCSCGAKLFFYIKKKPKQEEAEIQLSKKEREKIEKDVYDIIGDKPDGEAPIVLDLASINILKPGKFELDLVHLFNKKDPLIYKLEEGKYMIDIPSTFLKRNQKD